MVPYGLPAQTAAWVEREAGGRLVRARRLTGGITSAVHQVAVDTAEGRTILVLRRWTDGDRATAVSAVQREAMVLQALETTVVPAPRLVALSSGQATDGQAALLMSRLPGRLDLAPRDPLSALRQMAATLTIIQHLPLSDPALGLPVFEPGGRPHPSEVPRWAERPAVWREALTVLQSPPPENRSFTHGDFQQFNLLWTRGTLSGVVDWVAACVTSPDMDVGHCRLNLTILHGVERAEQFRLAYEAEAGRRVDPWWDLHRLTGYSPDWQRFIPIQVAGRIPVDTAGMTRRVEDTIIAALRRL